MFQKIKDQCNLLSQQFDYISDERKLILAKIAAYIQVKINQELPIKLVYICTHNSRRSHFGQVWAAVASSYYQLKNLTTYSGGTEATAFNSNAIQALISTGFDLIKQSNEQNAVYHVKFGEHEQTSCFSKVYDHPENPTEKFVAIMTCSDAEQNCPMISGAELRISTTYEDPKAFDGKPKEKEKYLERSNQIALETLYLFSLIK